MYTWIKASMLNRLFAFVAGGPEKGQRVAAATYLKNFLRSHWSDEKAMSVEERLEFRNQLMEVLLRVDGLVLKLLTEAVSHLFLLLKHHFVCDRSVPVSNRMISVSNQGQSPLSFLILLEHTFVTCPTTSFQLFFRKEKYV